MKLFCFKHLFLLSIIFVPFLFLDSSGATRMQRNASNNTLIGGGDKQVEYGVGEMLSDGPANGVKYGDSDIKLSGTGAINLTIPFEELQFEVCPSCTGTSKVCYETTGKVIERALECTGFSSYCAFQVRYNTEERNDRIFFGNAPVYVSEFHGSCLKQGCTKFSFRFAFREISPTFGVSFRFASAKRTPGLKPTIHSGFVVATGPIKYDNYNCEPKFDRGEKKIKLYIEIDPSCPIIVKNAQVYVPKILTTLPPQTAPRKETTPLSPGQAKDSTADAGFPWWGYLIIAAGCVLALIVIGVIVYFVCFKKPKASKALPPPETVVTSKPTKKVASPDVKPPTTTTTAAAAPVQTNDTPASTRKTDLNFTKFEPSKKSKKIQKKAATTQEPTTTEDAPPAPGSRQPVFDLSNAPEPVPVPYLKPHRLVPRSMKSAKTDSLEKTLPKEKKEMIETVADSAARHCLKSSESSVVQEMKSNYPEIKRGVTEAETELLSLPVSQMFVKINAIARESKKKLSAAGCEFDERRCITFVPESARSILQDEKTPATTVYFAFGAEYHQQVKCDKLNSYSLPLLMVIALQKRFEDRVRREACALIRRKAPIVLANNTEAARQKMPYPMNAIEKAYCSNPKAFRNLSEIKTDSESERRIKEMKEAAAAAEKKETVPGGGHDATRKKKSSKKRH